MTTTTTAFGETPVVGYRIVEIKNGKALSLFHGTQHSREITLDYWNEADIKSVRDGRCGKWYASGWHFLINKEDCEKMLEKRFRVKKNRRVVKCYVMGNLRKKSNSLSWLADKIYISSEELA